MSGFKIPKIKDIIFIDDPCKLVKPWQRRYDDIKVRVVAELHAARKEADKQQYINELEDFLKVLEETFVLRETQRKSYILRKNYLEKRLQGFTNEQKSINEKIVVTERALKDLNSLKLENEDNIKWFEEEKKTLDFCYYQSYLKNPKIEQQTSSSPNIANAKPHTPKPYAKNSSSKNNCFLEPKVLSYHRNKGLGNLLAS